MLVVTRGTVQHNGVVYVAGEPLPKLSNKDAQRLIQLGVATEMDQKRNATPAAPPPPSGKEDHMDPEAPSGSTAAGASDVPDDDGEDAGDDQDGDTPVDLHIDPANNIRSSPAKNNRGKKG
jgi:hypothetical protein